MKSIPTTSANRQLMSVIVTTILALLAFTRISFFNMGLIIVLRATILTSRNLKEQGFQIFLLPEKLMNVHTVVHKTSEKLGVRLPRA